MAYIFCEFVRAVISFVEMKNILVHAAFISFTCWSLCYIFWLICFCIWAVCLFELQSFLLKILFRSLNQLVQTTSQTNWSLFDFLDHILLTLTTDLMVVPFCLCYSVYGLMPARNKLGGTCLHACCCLQFWYPVCKPANVHSWCTGMFVNVIAGMLAAARCQPRSWTGLINTGVDNYLTDGVEFQDRVLDVFLFLQAPCDFFYNSILSAVC